MLHCSCKSALPDILVDYIPSVSRIDELMEDCLVENIQEIVEHIVEEVLGIKDDEEEYMEMESPQISCIETEDFLLQEPTIHYKIALY